MMKRFVCFLLLSITTTLAHSTGKIISCSGCSLNRLGELKSFLKDGEAEEYKGVEIEFIHGRNAILYVYNNDGVEQEQVTLSNYKTKEEMHRMMQEKGFVKKSAEEIQKLGAARKLQAAQAAEKEEAAAAAQGVGVENVITEEEEDIPEAKSIEWRAAFEAAQAALEEGRKDWKEVGLEAQQVAAQKLEGEARARRERRRAMEF